MKVLDLQCARGHTFEGWFASEEDFVSQCQRSLVECPLCGDAAVQKKLSAPRLNLHTPRGDSHAAVARTSTAASSSGIEVLKQPAGDAGITAAWLELSRRIVANTQDVGEDFAEEARRMHYGETEERAIRGKTTVDEARALLDEGIDVMPVVLPQGLKKPLQ